MTTIRTIAVSTVVFAAIITIAGFSQFTNASELKTNESTIAEAPLAQIADQLTGTWQTTKPIEESLDESGNTITMVLSIAPVSIDGMDNTLYAESVRSNTPWDPFRQVIFQLYDYKGKARLRTYTIAISQDSIGLYDGLTAAPESFPPLDKNQLIATLDVEISTTSNGFSGSTPYPYPTGVMNAVEMTSSVTFDGTTLTTADRGYDAQGNIVWGAAEDASYAFTRAAPYAVATQQDQGLITIDYPMSFKGEPVQEGDSMHAHYTGFMNDGSIFDSSYSRGEPYMFRYPPGTRAIVGWGMGMVGLSEGAHRKLIIPSAIAYGPSGNPRASIPGDQDLFFNVYLPQIDRPEPEPASEPASDPEIKAGIPTSESTED